MREIDPKTRELAGEEFVKRAEEAASKILNITPEMLVKFVEAEEACTCKHCGRCVLAGPPCCYDKVYEMYQELYSQVQWYKKIQSKKDKKINELKKRIIELSWKSSFRE